MHESKPHTQLELPLMLDLENVSLLRRIQDLEQYNNRLLLRMDSMDKDFARILKDKEEQIQKLSYQILQHEKGASWPTWVNLDKKVKW